jgi:4-amino-4-deoxy-L-arabinose transferase-like glycosyltransferase
VSTPVPDLLDRLCAGARAYLIIALIALAAALPGVFSLPPLDRDESRYAQASVQMLETGDFVRPYVQEAPRTKKPIGVHWLQSVSVAITTGPDARQIWPYRLPSVLGAVLASVGVFWAGAALVGRRAAFIGALMFAPSMMIATEGMIAKTDALLCASTVFAMGALARLKLGHGPRLPMVLAVWTFVAIGALIKGPVGPFLVALAIIALCAWERRLDWVRSVLDWRGMALATLLVAPWGIAILIETEGAFFAKSFAEDIAPKLTGAGEHKALPFGLHTLMAPMLLFPITLGLAPALALFADAFRAPRNGPAFAGVRFLIAWIAPFWLVMELVSTKLPHYTLVTFPALAIAAGAGLASWPRFDQWTRLAQVALFAAGAAGLIGVSAYAATLLPGDDAADARRAFQVGALGLVMMSALSIAVFTARKLHVALFASVACMLAFHVVLRERTLPEARSVLMSQEAVFALARHDLHPRAREGGAPLLVVGYREPSLVFMTRTDTILRQGAEAAGVAAPGQVVLVEGRERATFDHALAARGLAMRPIGAPAVGTNYSNGDRVVLQPGRIISAGSAASP